jgi:hypothetical protein
MSEPSYWYLGTSPISVPYWSDVTMYETEVGDDRVLAPMLFTTREKAAAELRRHEEAEADAYLQAVERYGEEDLNKALDNTPEQQVFGIGAWLLGEHLKDSDHRYVMVDSEVKTPIDLLAELEE